jgi:hypothetical protein
VEHGQIFLSFSSSLSLSSPTNDHNTITTTTTTTTSIHHQDILEQAYTVLLHVSDACSATGGRKKQHRVTAFSLPTQTTQHGSTFTPIRDCPISMNIKQEFRLCCPFQNDQDGEPRCDGFKLMREITPCRRDLQGRPGGTCKGLTPAKQSKTFTHVAGLGIE